MMATDLPTSTETRRERPPGRPPAPPGTGGQPAPAAGRAGGWVALLRWFLGALWLVHGLEKLGVRWPGWLHGGTGDVAAMLEEMAGSTALGGFAALLEGVFLPAAGALQWLFLVLELACAAALMTGARGAPGRRLYPWALAGGAALQAGLWLGFMGTDWPFQYPVLILAHLALLAVHVRPERAGAALGALAAVLAALWLTEGLSGRLTWLLAAPLAALALAAAPTFPGRLAALAGALAAAGGTAAVLIWAMPREAWGAWVWAYYAVAAAHLALLWRRPERQVPPA